MVAVSNGFTLTVACAEFIEPQTPLCTTALYKVVWIKLVAVKEVVLLFGVTVVHVDPAFTENSHLITDPVCPFKLKAVLLVPAQTAVVTGLIVPPTEEGFTEMVATEELADA